MKLEDILGLAIPVAFILFWGSEYLVNRAGGGRTFPNVRWWGLVGVGRPSIAAMPAMLVFADVNGERSPDQ